jgi:hypothetical protein
VDCNSLSFLQHLSLVAEKEKQTFMKTKTVLLCAAVAMFIGTVTSCGKDEVKTLTQYVEVRDTINIRDTIYVTINGIFYSTEDKFMVVGTNDWCGVAYGNGVWVAVGGSGKIATSTDGTNWSLQTVGSGNWYGAAYKDGRWVAVGDGAKIFTSTDNGANWTVGYDGSIEDSWNGVAVQHNPNKPYSVWVAVGSSGQIARTPEDPIFHFAPPQKVGTNNWNSVATDSNGIWVVVGSGGQVGISTDNGKTWTTQTLGASVRWYGVAYSNGVWVAVGSFGQISVSTDGTNWTSYALGADHNGLSTIIFNGVAYSNGVWVAVGGSGKIATSTDGTNWSLQTVGSGNWYGVAIKTD